MRRQNSGGTIPPKKPLPSKREEALEAIRQRDALWALLGSIEKIDAEDVNYFRELVLTQTKRRFEIYNPG